MAVTRFAFKLGDGHNYIDLAQCMSMVQRTMVRQKQNFTVLGGQVVDNSAATVKISTAPDFWYIRAAINRCFKAWKDQRSRTLAGASENANVGTAKYSDFKISLNGVSTANNLLPHFTGASSITEISDTGIEWATASVVSEEAVDGSTERHFKILGAHTGGYYGAVKGWLVTRTIPDSEFEPDMLDLDGNSVLDYKEDMLNLLNETGDGQPERLTLLYEDNDTAPFATRDIYGDIDDSYNLQLQSLSYTSGALGTTSAMVPGFKALCGLVHVNVAAGSDPILFLDVLNTPEAF